MQPGLPSTVNARGVAPHKDSHIGELFALLRKPRLGPAYNSNCKTPHVTMCLQAALQAAQEKRLDHPVRPLECIQYRCGCCSSGWQHYLIPAVTDRLASQPVMLRKLVQLTNSSSGIQQSEFGWPVLDHNNLKIHCMYAIRLAGWSTLTWIDKLHNVTELTCCTSISYLLGAKTQPDAIAQNTCNLSAGQPI